MDAVANTSMLWHQLKMAFPTGEFAILLQIPPFAFKSDIKNHIKPNLGAIKLDALTPHAIQGFYNSLRIAEEGQAPLSPKTIKNIHGVLHKALQQAVLNEYIRSNPANACTLPRIEKKEIKPMDEKQITEFLKAIRGHQFEDLFIVTLFTGMRKHICIAHAQICKLIHIKSGHLI